MLSLPQYVATVLTVYGIETTMIRKSGYHMFLKVATVLTVYGIETLHVESNERTELLVATVLTVYGIETTVIGNLVGLYPRTLQQYLPFTVLKLNRRYVLRLNGNQSSLQQYLPFTVLKPSKNCL